MKQYLIIYGPMGISPDKASPVSVTSDGKSLTVTGPKPSVDYWSSVLGSSIILAASVKDGQASLNAWTASNSMLDTLFFDDKDYDMHSAKFESITGTRKTVPIHGLTTDEDGFYTREERDKFNKKVKPLLDMLDNMSEIDS